MKMNEEKIKEWKLLLAERKQRGLRIEEFCKVKNITVPQFYYYHKKVKQSEARKNKEAGKAVIQPIKIVNSQVKENTVVRFILPNSFQCILPRDMTMSEIKNILELVMTC